MSSKKGQSAIERRKTLKKILAGTGAAGVAAVAPQNWTTPVINSVVLPSHAQTSRLSLNYSDPNAGAMMPSDLLDSLVPSAHAGSEAVKALCINFNSDMTTYNAALESDSGQLSVVEGKVGIEETILSASCNPGSRTFKLLNGPSENGVPWEIYANPDVARFPVSSGIAQASDCIVDVSSCQD